jgi:AraC-like DNA-binding protein
MPTPPSLLPNPPATFPRPDDALHDGAVTTRPGPTTVPPATARMAELLRSQIDPSPGASGPVPGVRYLWCDRYVPSQPVVYEPSICILAAGRKVVRLGKERFTYDADNFLVLSVPLPVESEVFASPDEPMLGVRLEIDPVALAELILEVGRADVAAATSAEPPRGIFASRFTDELREACLRLVECLGRPTDARILAPGIVREITYRILSTDQAHALRAVAVRHARFTQISRVLKRIHQDFDSTVSVEALAAEAGMSLSSFHENFRAVTRTSPLQYVKTVRLHKARTLMIQEGLTAAETSVRVGYESASQFSREFKRLFGRTPARDAAVSRATLMSSEASR